MYKSKVISIPQNKLKLNITLKFWSATDNTEKFNYAEIKTLKDKSFRALDPKEFKTIMKAALRSEESKYKENFRSSGIMPKNIIYLDMVNLSRFIWFSPVRKRKIIISTRTNSKINGIHELKIPMMIFFVNGRTLEVYFTDKVNGEETKLISTCFMNISDNDYICLGSQQIKEFDNFETISEFLTHWEDIFFLSPFTHNSKSNWMFSEEFEPETYTDAWKYIIKQKEIKLEWIKKSKTIIKNLIS